MFGLEKLGAYLKQHAAQNSILGRLGSIGTELFAGFKNVGGIKRTPSVNCFENADNNMCSSGY